jgi:hypothetical protein
VLIQTIAAILQCPGNCVPLSGGNWLKKFTRHKHKGA